jgi:hypothetical protein
MEQRKSCRPDADAVNCQEKSTRMFFFSLSLFFTSCFHCEKNDHDSGFRGLVGNSWMNTMIHFGRSDPPSYVVLNKETELQKFLYAALLNFLLFTIPENVKNMTRSRFQHELKEDDCPGYRYTVEENSTER